MIIHFNDMTLEASNFLQEEDGGYIAFNSNVTSEDFEKIVNMRFDLDNNFISVRFNGSEQLMRFGAIAFSKHEDIVKIQVNFVNKTYEGMHKKTEKYAFSEKEYNVDRYVTELRLLNEKLMNLLLEKGIISETEKANIQTSTKKERHRKAIEFFEVDDIDDYEL
jgi:hypothetical protein